MATFAQIKARVAAVAGLPVTGDEGGLLDSIGNDAYQMCVADAELNVDEVSIDLTAGASSFDLPTLGLTDSLRILQISDADGYRFTPLNNEDLLDTRGGRLSADTNQVGYAIKGLNLLQLDRELTADLTVTVEYVKEPAALVDASVPALIPKRFHFDLLANRMMELAFEYDQIDVDRSQYHAQKADIALARLIALVGRYQTDYPRYGNGIYDA